jgi:hypothetical protein
MGIEDRAEQITPALAEAKRRRADLHHALVEVEEATSAPAPGREPLWALDVAKSLTSLVGTIDEHIVAAERPGGLYDEIVGLAPHLSGKVGRLRDEHPALRNATTSLIEKLQTVPFDDVWTVDEARDAIQRLLGKIVRHRQHGADLVWEAYNLDVGGHES